MSRTPLILIRSASSSGERDLSGKGSPFLFAKGLCAHSHFVNILEAWVIVTVGVLCGSSLPIGNSRT
ncbi:Uncharacterized protein TCM_022559 [Theobroma cacao]|uniref:Uncharacterized protein n=1 Tax=Theobroma cacao TaxID=3641 RepID=A0A061EV15_THECC|nr:Uncharacterized protein TCM_022559 [Theobroma cacao]